MLNISRAVQSLRPKNVLQKDSLMASAPYYMQLNNLANNTSRLHYIKIFKEAFGPICLTIAAILVWINYLLVESYQNVTLLPNNATIRTETVVAASATSTAGNSCETSSFRGGNICVLRKVLGVPSKNQLDWPVDENTNLNDGQIDTLSRNYRIYGVRANYNALTRPRYGLFKYQTDVLKKFNYQTRKQQDVYIALCDSAVYCVPVKACTPPGFM